MTPLMWACYHNRPKNVGKLLKYGADIDEKDIEGKSACHWAVHEGGDIACLKMLLTFENSFWRDISGRAVIHLAAECKSKRAIKLALTIRPDSVHDVDKNGRTPLHWAAACGSSAAVKCLLAGGADAGVRDKRGASARDYVQAKRLTWQVGSDVATELDICSRLLQEGPVASGQRPASAASTRSDGGGLGWEGDGLDNVSMKSFRLEEHAEVMSERIMDLRRKANAVMPQSPISAAADTIMTGTHLRKFNRNGGGQGLRKFFWYAPPPSLPGLWYLAALCWMFCALHPLSRWPWCLLPQGKRQREALAVVQQCSRDEHEASRGADHRGAHRSSRDRTARRLRVSAVGACNAWGGQCRCLGCHRFVWPA